MRRGAEAAQRVAELEDENARLRDELARRGEVVARSELRTDRRREEVKILRRRLDALEAALLAERDLRSKAEERIALVEARRASEARTWAAEREELERTAGIREEGARRLAAETLSLRERDWRLMERTLRQELAGVREMLRTTELLAASGWELSGLAQRADRGGQAHRLRAVVGEPRGSSMRGKGAGERGERGWKDGEGVEGVEGVAEGKDSGGESRGKGRGGAGGAGGKEEGWETLDVEGRVWRKVTGDRPMR